MKERGILYRAPMVRAKLAGIKTQTRRIIDPQPPGAFYGPKHYHPSITNRRGDMRPGPKTFGIFDPFGEWSIKCPYGQPGDRLWGRETYRQTCDNKSFGCVQYRADESLRLMLCDENGEGDPIGTKQHKEPFQKVGKKGPPWKPSIFMPRWASRILDEIIEIRVERVQDITEEDAIAEGSQSPGVPASLTNRGAFAKLWHEINGPESWAANPWVWVIVTKPILPAPSAAGR